MKKRTLLIMALCMALTSAHAQVITKIGRATLPLIAAASMLPVSTPKWYDIYGRPVMRNSFAKGILINCGKKYMVR